MLCTEIVHLCTKIECAAFENWIWSFFVCAPDDVRVLHSFYQAYVHIWTWIYKILKFALLFKDFLWNLKSKDHASITKIYFLIFVYFFIFFFFIWFFDFLIFFSKIQLRFTHKTAKELLIVALSIIVISVEFACMENWEGNKYCTYK